MAQLDAGVVRFFILGVFLWVVPGVISPAQWLGAPLVRDLAYWLGNVGASVCFFVAYRKASTRE
jgi:hypothetical protein